MTHIHYYNRIKGIFTALKIFCALPIYPPFHLCSWVPAPKPLATTDLFTISLVFANRWFLPCYSWQTMCMLKNKKSEGAVHRLMRSHYKWLCSRNMVLSWLCVLQTLSAFRLWHRSQMTIDTSNIFQVIVLLSCHLVGLC